ncbi:Uncharacterised protein [uncultured archaeon]|nr:Uncharacterised protein [uncultured archaeon]
MTCYMTGYMDASFLRLVAEGLAPRKKGKTAGGEADGIHNGKND